jgi:sodium transport system permease protein
VNTQHILHIFRKDGLELLRDRRTLFVNVLLPVLLFPLVSLFLIQVMQIANSQKTEPPRIAVIGGDEQLGECLLHRPDDGKGPVEGADNEPTTSTGSGQAADIVALTDADMDQLRRRSAKARDLAERALDEKGGGPLHALLEEERAELLRILREQNLAAALVADHDGEDRHIEVVLDDAHSDHDAARILIKDGVELYQRRLVDDNLRRAGLPRRVIEPVVLDHLSVATVAESIRSRLAGMIPILLVIMALSGAFYPALDLLAGERERGTLESLLSWPVHRRDIFLGKLLVTCAAAIITVVLNLASGMITFAIAGSQLGAANDSIASMLSSGVGVLAASFIVLLPLTISLATVSLALAGLAASAKEAQNYLSPLIIVVMVAAGVAAIPGARPNMALDIVPITGPVLALKESLRSANIPWGHLLLSTAASLALAAVIIAWAVRLLEHESFCYPGLVRAGWGRFRRWGPIPPMPNALEAVAVFAIAVGGLTMAGGLMRDLPAPGLITVPLLAFVLMPALVHAWLGNYSRAQTLGLRATHGSTLLRTLAAIPFAVVLSVCLGTVTQGAIPKEFELEIMEKMLAVNDLGGLPLLLLCVAVVPAVCEELLCRGTLLAGLRRSLGDPSAIVISAFLFAVLHMSPFRFLPQFTLGLALAWLVVRSGSIIPAMLLHAGHNAAVVIASMPFEPDPSGEAAVAIAHPFSMGIAAALGLYVCIRGCRENSTLNTPGADGRAS